MKCSTGERFVMKGNLNCPYQGRYQWKDDVADAAVKALDNFKNPYDTRAANPVTKGGQYWYDKDVGYVRIHTESNTKLQIHKYKLHWRNIATLLVYRLCFLCRWMGENANSIRRVRI